MKKTIKAFISASLCLIMILSFIPADGSIIGDLCGSFLIRGYAATLTQYRYRDKEWTTSYNTSLSGYSRSGGTWVQSGSGTYYYASFPSGYSTSDQYYINYGKSAKSSTESATEKAVYSSSSSDGWIYWHWGCSWSGLNHSNTQNWLIGDYYGEVLTDRYGNRDTAYYFCSFKSSTKATNYSADNCASMPNRCEHSQWFREIPVYKQSYTKYKMLFNYYKWGNWSSWSYTKPASNSDREIETRQVYEVLYNANGGTGEPSSQIKVNGTSLTLSQTKPTRTEYSFLGWSTSSSATSPTYYPGDTYSQNTSITLYAVWSRTDATKPTGSIKSTNNVASSQTVTLSFSDDVGVAGYYWGTNSNYSGNAYTATSSSSVSKTISSSGIYYLTVKDTNGNISSTYSATFYKTTLNANGGSVFPASVLTKRGNTFTLPTPTKSGYIFQNWNTKSDGTGTGYASGATYSVSKDITLYAVWNQADTTKPTGSISSTNSVASSQTVTLSLSDNIGVAGYYWGTSSTYSNNTYTVTSSSSVSKTVSSAGTYYLTVKDTSGNVSSNYSVSFYKTTLNANGGSVSPTSVLTKSGCSFTFPTPKKSGYTYSGWSTSSSAASGVKSLTPSSSTTYFAVWIANNIYNLGEETYSFSNYGDSDSPGGHCFGMAVTSSGYYTGDLNKTIFRGSDSDTLYSYSDSTSIRKPICYYLKIQGPGAEYNSMVAGGSIDLKNKINTKDDWNSCVNYVKNHNFDNRGSLNIGMWYASGGGHAVNFLYYKNVDGQDRIYAYDNNYPKFETYYYMGTNGYIHETSERLSYDLRSDIKGMDLMDVYNYFKLAPEFDAKRFIYANKNEIKIEDAEIYHLKCSEALSDYVMYEISEDITEVTVIPLVDDAKFQYVDEEYCFGSINQKTYGVLKIRTKDSTEGIDSKDIFEIKNAPVNINVASAKTVNYRSIVTITATAENVPEGYILAIYVDGKKVAGDNNRSVTYLVGELKSDINYTVKVVDANGNVVKDSNGNDLFKDGDKITCNKGFFGIIVAFFKGLFGTLPKVEIKPQIN